uniref:NB-ARC domain-containing protein n=1 Tax=Oryza punctata TaxID=4537 RepID=A0A0E0LGE7_ORYPU
MKKRKTPKIDIKEVFLGRAVPHGKFDLVVKRSHLPPYYSYLYRCEIHEYRSISFLIKNFSKSTASNMEERLQRLLLRFSIIVEEADDRLITNQAMLQQLNILRKDMYRGYYTLDSFRCHGRQEDNPKDHEVSHTFEFNPAKRIRFFMVSSQSLQEQLYQVLGSLQVTLEDNSDFVMFLNSCPRLCRQPYSTHLLLDKCLFNRQMEMEHIMNFLLKEDTTGAENLGVLPIIGPRKVGKSTLIEHACNDERVLDHFSQIVCFGDGDLKDAHMMTLRDSGVIKHQNRATGAGITLIVIELTRDIDKGVWRRLYSASKNYFPNGSKIIIASRSDKIASFGTAHALRVKFFTKEAYWHFFKVRTFGSINAEEHPKLASIAMDMAREMNGCFMGSCIYSSLLKANFNARFWSMALESIREFKKTNLLVCGAYHDHPWQASEPAYVRTVNKISSEYLVILDEYQTCSVQNMVHRHTISSQTQSNAEVPRLSMQDFLFGSVRPQGKFKVLAWRSHLPPHYNYIFNCEVRTSHHTVVRKKRSQFLLIRSVIYRTSEHTLHMETFLSVILSDLASKSISFLINKCSKPTASNMEDRLQQLLLRVRIIVEEAEGRLITNQGMLLQLNILRKEMYRGYYTLDRFRCHGHEEDNTKDNQVSNSFAQSKFNPAKRVRFFWVSGHSLQEQLKQVVGSIEVTLEDVRVFVMFLNGCPSLCRQPYSMHLLFDKCLFGRQMEMEHIMNFLLKEDSPGAENPGVLPIIGRPKAGKSTLIEHACNDERVCNHFHQIVYFSDDDLKDANMVTLRDRGAIKHQNHGTCGERILIVIELIRDIDEGVWRRLYSVYKSCVPNGSKIIVASQSDKIARFGTTQAIRVELFTKEAYWHFFKVRTFGSINAQEHPKLASIAMDMARELDGCFMGASIYSGLLKANFSARFWNMALACIREFKRTNLLVYGAHIDNPWQTSEPTYVRKVNKTSSEYLVILDDYQTFSIPNMVDCYTNSAQSEAEVPEVSIQDFLFASVIPQGKFKVLAWRSHLPPHYNYMLSCEVQRKHHMVAKKKRSQELCT